MVCFETKTSFSVVEADCVKVLCVKVCKLSKGTLLPLKKLFEMFSCLLTNTQPIEQALSGISSGIKL